MTVAKLIEELQKYDPHLECEVQTATRSKVSIKEVKQGTSFFTSQITDETEEYKFVLITI